MTGCAGKESRLLEVGEGLAIFPGVDASVGVGCRIGQPSLGFAGVGLVGLGKSAQLKVNDEDVHGSQPKLLGWEIQEE